MLFFLGATCLLSFIALEVGERARQQRLRKESSKARKAQSSSCNDELLMVDPEQLSVRMLCDSQGVEKLFFLEGVGVTTRDRWARIDAMARIEFRTETSDECQLEVENLLYWLLRAESLSVTSRELQMHPDRLAQRVLGAFNSKQPLGQMPQMHIVDLKLLSSLTGDVLVLGSCS